jgi:hypothetical protein
VTNTDNTGNTVIGEPENRSGSGRDARGRFVAGSSGNRGGRPVEHSELKNLCRIEGPASVQTLVAIRDDPEVAASDRITAARTLLDRGYGRPEQRVSLPDGGLININVGGGVVTDAGEAARIHLEYIKNPQIDISAVTFDVRPPVLIEEPVAVQERIELPVDAVVELERTAPHEAVEPDNVVTLADHKAEMEARLNTPAVSAEAVLDAALRFQEHEHRPAVDSLCIKCRRLGMGL